MKIAIALIISFAASVASSREADRLVDVTFGWYSKNHKAISTALRTNNSPQAIPYIHAVGYLYDIKEGSIGIEVGPAIATALIYNTDTMLSWFAAHPSTFQVWVERIQFDVFTDYTGT